MAAELGWDDARLHAELSSYHEQFGVNGAPPRMSLNGNAHMPAAKLERARTST
jgi:hypothetical protein